MISLMLVEPTMEAFCALLSTRMLLSVFIFVFVKKEFWFVSWFVNKFVS